MLFGGMISILEQSGAVHALVHVLHRPLHRLFGQNVSPEAMESIAMNLSANMLGMGNAATPMGMRAARLLTMDGQNTPSAALCLLLVINSTSVQLVPTSVIALRYAAGSNAPESIIVPGLAASATATVCGILVCKLCEKRKKHP